MSKDPPTSEFSSQPGRLDRPAPVGRVILTAPLQPNQSIDNFVASLAFGLRERHAKTLLIDARHSGNDLTEMMKVRAPTPWDRAAQGNGGLSKALTENTEGIFVLNLRESSPSSAELKQSLKHQFVQLHRSFDLVLVAGPSQPNQLNWLLEDLRHDFLAVLNAQNHGKLDTYELFEQHIDPSDPERLLVVCDQTESNKQARQYFREFETISDIFFENESEFLGDIVLDRAQKKASLFRKPVTQLFPRAKSARSIEAISDRLAMILIDEHEAD